MVFIERACTRTTENTDRIEFSVLDATDSDALMALGERRFDAAVCTMAIMDMSSIEPMIRPLSRLLRAGKSVRFFADASLIQCTDSGAYD